MQRKHTNEIEIMEFKHFKTQEVQIRQQIAHQTETKRLNEIIAEQQTVASTNKKINCNVPAPVKTVPTLKVTLPILNVTTVKYHKEDVTRKLPDIIQTSFKCDIENNYTQKGITKKTKWFSLQSNYSSFDGINIAVSFEKRKSLDGKGKSWSQLLIYLNLKKNKNLKEIDLTWDMVVSWKGTNAKKQRSLSTTYHVFKKPHEKIGSIISPNPTKNAEINVVIDFTYVAEHIGQRV